MVGIIDKLIKPIADLASEFITDKDKANEFKANLYSKVLENEGELIKASSGIIMAEAKSESWLTRSWRPITMISFVAMVWSYWLGYTPANVTPETLNDVFDLIKIGLGGYVVSRGGEKIVKEYKKN